MKMIKTQINNLISKAPHLRKPEFWFFTLLSYFIIRHFREYILNYFKYIFSFLLNDDQLNSGGWDTFLQLLTQIPFVILFLICNMYYYILCERIRGFLKPKSKLDNQDLDIKSQYYSNLKNLDINPQHYSNLIFESLEDWAKDNDLYDEVPEHLWVELRKATDLCKNKRYGTKFSLKNLNMWNEEYGNLIKIRKEILDNFNKKK